LPGTDEDESTKEMNPAHPLANDHEELTEEQVAEYENLFDSEEDAWGDWDTEESEEYEESFLEEDEDEEENEKNKKQ